MANVVRLKDVQALAAKKEARLADRAVKAARAGAGTKHAGSIRNKKFKNLNAAEKDKLLKAMAIQLGLIDDDDD